MGWIRQLQFFADRGELELNIWESIIMKNLFDAFSLLISSIPIFNQKCVEGIQINKETNQRNSERSYSISIVISKLFGYDIANKVVTEAVETNATVKEIVIKNGLLSKEEADKLLNPMNLVYVDV